MSNKKNIGQIIAVAFWVTAWFIIAYLVGNKLLVASPIETLSALIRMMQEKIFYQAIGRSFLRIFGGFIVGFGIATLLAIISYKLEMAKYVIAPFVSLCKSMPVAVFAVVLIIWWGPGNLSFFISAIVVLPVVFNNILEGLQATDEKLLEMAQVFKLSAWNKAMFVYRPALKSYIVSAVKTSIGMSWKAGVAGEVIGLTNLSVGGALYTSKVYFNTDEVFAWAFVVIVASSITEKVIVKFTKFLLECKVKAQEKQVLPAGEGNIVIKDLYKGFGSKVLYEKYNAQFASGEKYVINQESGSGKTTLLKMIAGLVKPDNGTIKCQGSISMVFQEDRLCEDYSAVDNVSMTGISRENAKEALLKVLDADCIDKPCRQLSGGMKRRVAIVRAVTYPSDIILLDEPFTGMDEGTLQVVKKYIDDYQRARTVIVATHIL